MNKVPGTWNPFNIPVGLCCCGCGSATPVYNRNYHDRGLKKGEHAKFISFHEGRINFTINDSGCWIWNGKGDKNGYAMTRWDYKTIRVHRAYYEKFKGKIPDGLVLDHLCRTPPCVNPDHLEPVTSQTNTQRGVTAHLTWKDVEYIRNSPERVIDLMARFSVVRNTIWRIKKGIRWNN